MNYFYFLLIFLLTPLLYTTSFAQYDPAKDPGLKAIRALQEEIARARTPEQKNLLQKKLDELTKEQATAEKTIMKPEARRLQEQAKLQSRVNAAARRQANVRLRGLGGFGYGQQAIDIIANWDEFSLAAKKQHCYSLFGSDAFKSKYGYSPTWQRVFNLGFLTDEQLKNYLRQRLESLLHKDDLTGLEKKLREAYVKCLTVLQEKEDEK